VSTVDRIDCERVRAATHRRLDGDALSAADLALLDAHLATCAACRTALSELETIQQALRAIPVPSFPSHDLPRVWARTSRGTPSVRLTSRRAVLRVAAAVGGLALALGGLWWSLPSRPEMPVASAAEIRRAADEARFVLGVAANALARTERAATDGVLVRGVGAALDRTSIRWSGAAPARPVKGGDGV